MRISEIENWASQIIEAVNNNQPVEDSRVELKSSWIDSVRAARRLAGHANAARGNPILWLFGVDEINGVIGVDHQELSTHFSKIIAEFRGPYPKMQDVVIYQDGKTILALYFETNQPPYVVKNPAFGKSNGGPVALETPWREGTCIRSADHNDLIQILVPVYGIPGYEILSANFIGEISSSDTDKYLWRLFAELYLVPKNESRIIIPFHRCNAKCLFSQSIGWLALDSFHISPPYTFGKDYKRIYTSKTIECSDDEVILRGPGKVYLEASILESLPDDLQPSVDIETTLLTIESDLSLNIEFSLAKYSSPRDNYHLWEYTDQAI